MQGEGGEVPECGSLAGGPEGFSHGVFADEVVELAVGLLDLLGPWGVAVQVVSDCFQSGSGDLASDLWVGDEGLVRVWGVGLGRNS